MTFFWLVEKKPVRPVFRVRTQYTCRVFFRTARSSVSVLVLVLKKSSVLNRFQFHVLSPLPNNSIKFIKLLCDSHAGFPQARSNHGIALSVARDTVTRGNGSFQTEFVRV